MSDLPSLHRLRARLRIRHLVLLDELGRSLNLHQCALAMSLTQPAASKLLKEVELLVGHTLFERSRSGMRPNLLGQSMIEHARIVLTELEATHVELTAINSGASGQVRLGIFPVAAPVLLGRAVRLLQQSHPDLRIELREGLEDSLLPALRGGELDFVVGRMVAESANSGLRCEILFDEPTVIVCGPAHPLARNARLDGAELDRFQWILPSSNAPLYALVATALAAHGASFPRVTVSSGAPLVIVSLLQQTSLLSAIPLRVAQYMAAHGHLEILPLALPSRLHPVAITLRAGVPLTRAATVALDAIRQAASSLDAAATDAAPLPPTRPAAGG